MVHYPYTDNQTIKFKFYHQNQYYLILNISQSYKICINCTNIVLTITWIVESSQQESGGYGIVGANAGGPDLNGNDPNTNKNRLRTRNRFGIFGVSSLFLFVHIIASIVPFFVCLSLVGLFLFVHSIRETFFQTDITGRWCYIQPKWDWLAGKGIEGISYVFVFILYMQTIIQLKSIQATDVQEYVKRELNFSSENAQKMITSYVWNQSHRISNINQLNETLSKRGRCTLRSHKRLITLLNRLFFIPFAFIFTRLPGTTRWSLTYTNIPKHNNSYWLELIQAFFCSNSIVTMLTFVCGFVQIVVRFFLAVIYFNMQVMDGASLNVAPSIEFHVIIVAIAQLSSNLAIQSSINAVDYHTQAISIHNVCGILLFCFHFVYFFEFVYVVLLINNKIDIQRNIFDKKTD